MAPCVGTWLIHPSPAIWPRLLEETESSGDLCDGREACPFRLALPKSVEKRLAPLGAALAGCPQGDTRSRHKRPPPRCAGPLRLFRFAARASLTAACQSGGRVTVICVRESLRSANWQLDYGALADGVGHGCRLLPVRQPLKPCCCSMSQRRSLRYVPGILPHRSKLMNTTNSRKISRANAFGRLRGHGTFSILPSAVSSVRSRRRGVIEIQPFSMAQRSVPGSAFSKGVTVNQKCSRPLGSLSGMIFPS